MNWLPRPGCRRLAVSLEHLQAHREHDEHQNRPHAVSGDADHAATSTAAFAAASAAFWRHSAAFADTSAICRSM